MSFKALGLSPSLIKTVEELDYKNPTPIQELAIPAVLKKKDVLGIAKTGSGKTASYVLPILMNLKGNTESNDRNINVLVLVPTRELAVQVQEVFRQFSAGLPYPMRSLAVFGGASINPQMKALYKVNILVATPGRLIDLVNSNALQLTKVSTLVMDEADKLLNLGFKDELDQILKLLPTKRQNLLFSATLSPKVQNIESILLNQPEICKIEEKEEEIGLINQVGYFVDDEKKGPLLRYLIKTNNMQQVLVFASSVYKVNNIVDKLKKNGIQAKAIHGKKSQGTRTDTLEQFKAKHLQVLVTTDLLARGIDIEFLPFVVNYELPRSPKDFVHRIGRTGRAENKGEAISFITPEDKHHFRVIQKKMKQWVTMIDSDKLNLQGF